MMRQLLPKILLIAAIISAVLAGVAWFALTQMAFLELAAPLWLGLVSALITGSVFTVLYLDPMVKALKQMKQKWLTKAYWQELWQSFKDATHWGRAKMLLPIFLSLIITGVMISGIYFEWYAAIATLCSCATALYMAIIATPAYFSFSIHKAYNAFVGFFKGLKRDQHGNQPHIMIRILDGFMMFLLMLIHFCAEGIHSAWGYWQEKQVLLGTGSFILHVIYEALMDIPALFGFDYDGECDHDHEDITPVAHIARLKSKFLTNPVFWLAMVVNVLPLLFPQIPWIATIIAALMMLRADYNYSQKQPAWYQVTAIIGQLVACTTGVIGAFLFVNLLTFLPGFILYPLVIAGWSIESAVIQSYLNHAFGIRKREEHHHHHPEPVPANQLPHDAVVDGGGHRDEHHHDSNENNESNDLVSNIDAIFAAG